MIIYIRARNHGRYICLDVEHSDTVYDMKKKIFDKEGIPSITLMIFWKEKRTFDNQTVSELGTLLL